MARMNFIIPEDLEARLRRKALDVLGGKKGSISQAICEGIELWLDKHET